MKFRALFILLVTLVLISACNSKSGRKDASLTTGWVYNNDKYGGFEVTDEATYYNNRVMPPGMIYIKGGTFTMGRISGEVLSDANNQPRRVTVQSFFMDQFEISNVQWREYVHWLDVVYHQMPKVGKMALPDTTVWRRDLAFNEPLVSGYFRHVAYNNYPVVGVSWKQADDFCKWRTDRVNEKILADRGFLFLPDFDSIRTNTNQEYISNNLVFNTSKYLFSSTYQPMDKKDRPIPKTNWDEGHLLPEFRLPFEAEWEYAAYGIIGIEGEENYGQRRIYPWDGHSLRNPDKKFRGEMLANFSRGRGDMGGMASRPNDGFTATAPVDYFAPNDYGLFNMAGNVNEWVSDVYRTQSFKNVEEYNPYRGNQFREINWSNQDVNGSTLRLPKLDSLGRVEYILLDSLTDDVRNAKDGSSSSLLNKDDWKSNMTPDQATTKMYTFEGQDAILSSRISNQTRVYKGGGWRDRPYWLQPATRRYLDETKARDDLGFRCAMTYMGTDM